MPDTTTIIVGNLTDDPELRHTESGDRPGPTACSCARRRDQQVGSIPALITPGQRQRAVQ